MSFLSTHKQSLTDSSAFYLAATQKELTWFESPTLGLTGDLRNQQWFVDGITNACHNAVDRHASETPSKTAILVSNNDNIVTSVTYSELKRVVMEVAGVLKKLNVQKGNCVTIYLPMGLEAVAFALGCARIGVTHNVVFGGYSAESLGRRIKDSRSNVVVTCSEAMREKKKIDFLGSTKQAVNGMDVKILIVEDVLNRGNDCCKVSKENDEIKEENLFRYEDLVVGNDQVECVPVPSEHPLFYLYTSGSTGSPKGVVHTTGGYLTYIAMTLRDCFRFECTDTMCCTADLGWITGHSYALYGPLLLGATTVLVGGSPLYPSEFRLFSMVSDLKITHLYTAPTAIRVLKQSILDEAPISTYDLSTLRVLGSVGEPISEEAYCWYSRIFGDKPVVDTYFQTETGGFLITPIVGETSLVPGRATQPFYGLSACLYGDLIKNEDAVVNISKEGGTMIEKGLKEEEISKIDDNLKNEGLKEGGAVCQNEEDVVKNAGAKRNEFFSKTDGNKRRKPCKKIKIVEETILKINTESILENNLPTEKHSLLLIDGAWPGIARTILNDHKRYENSYFLEINGKTYFKTGDEAEIDSEGGVWVRGRADDVLNVSGHRFSTAEIEGACYRSPLVAEAAVVGVPDSITGQAIYVFCVTSHGEEARAAVRKNIRECIGPIATPKQIVICEGVPKTRTGKIMRNLLRNLLRKEMLGDVSTCANLEVIEKITKSIHE